MYVDTAIKNAKEGQALYGAELIEDPSDGIIRVHLVVVEYNMKCRRFGMNADDLVELQGMAEELLIFCET